MLSKAEAVDQQEDQEYGTDYRGDELPRELACGQSRLKRIQEAKKALEAEAKSAAQQAQKQREEENSGDDDEPKRGRKSQPIPFLLTGNVH